tara:strand:+ start:174 stop:458 length:285 start_codon:yes stop_codon:yes gene_type:complete
MIDMYSEVLDVGAGFLIEPPDSNGRFEGLSDSYRVWPQLVAMPHYYGHDEILSANSFQDFVRKEDAEKFSDELGKLPIYWRRREGENIAVTRIR